MREDLPVFLSTFLVLITCKQRGPFKTGNNNRASLFQVLPFFNQINYFVADKNRYSLKISFSNCRLFEITCNKIPKMSQEFQT